MTEVATCPDCRRPLGELERRDDGDYATDGECLARVPKAGPLFREECKDLLIARLRSDLAAAREGLSDWELIKNEPVVQGRLAVIQYVAQRKERGR